MQNILNKITFLSNFGNFFRNRSLKDVLITLYEYKGNQNGGFQ